MIRRPPRSTRTDTLFPYTTLFRSAQAHRRRVLLPDLQPVHATLQFQPHLPLFATDARALRSEEHTSELQSLMRISYAVFCLKKKTPITTSHMPSRRLLDNENNIYCLRRMVTTTTGSPLSAHN